MRLSIKTFAPAIIFLLLSGCNTLPAESLLQTEQPNAPASIEPSQSLPTLDAVTDGVPAASVASQPPTAVLPTAVAVLDEGPAAPLASETRLGFNVRGWT